MMRWRMRDGSTGFGAEIEFKAPFPFCVKTKD
jgi:hypothetical protein